MPRLTLQDKLALALTSTSVSEMSRQLGVSRSTVRRWLNSGPPEARPSIGSEGVRSIPQEASKAIDGLFKRHKAQSKAQSQAIGIPFDSTKPVFYQRPERADGRPSDRIFASNTHFLSPQLRINHLHQLQDTKKFFGISVASKVNLLSYLRGRPATEPEGAKALKAIERAFKNKKKTYSTPISEGPRPTLFENWKTKAEQGEVLKEVKVYTRQADFRFGADSTLEQIENTLRQKHGPAAAPGGFATEILIQLPTQPQQPQQAPSKPRKKPVKGR